MSDWGIPREQYYKQHKKIAATKTCEKNVFASYGNNILIHPNRTVSELEFERWCEDYDSVDCYYKNGDKGAEFFSSEKLRAFLLFLYVCQ